MRKGQTRKIRKKEKIVSNTSVTLKEITTTIRHLKAAVKKGNRALFDNNAAYLRTWFTP